MEQDQDNIIKIIVLGSSSVGKTCILIRGFDNIYNETISTVGIDFKTRLCKFEDKKMKVNYIDTAGQEQFRAISLNYLKGADGVILVFDVTNRETFELVNSWIDDIRENNQMSIAKILIGNKIDLVEERDVSKTEGEQLANILECPYFETSAKTGKNVNEALDEIAKITFNQWKTNNSNRQSIRIRSEESIVKQSENQDKKGCCGSSKQK